MNETAHPRTIRSFVRRAGRMTRAQARALEELWPRFGIAWEPAPLDLDALFGRSAPRVLEIGFGTGAALVQQALDHPERDLLGIEVHEPGVGHCLLEIERLGLTNIRLACHDAIELLRGRLPAGSLHGVQLFFPDPWHKKRHHKRRIVQPEFVALVARVLEPGGYLHIATDWPDYAGHIQAVLAAQQALVPDPDRQPERARTRFEARGERLGHPIWDGIWRRAG